jgi:hypothetical protein
MPLELGVFLGAKRFGVGGQRLKQCIVLERERYRFQKYISDIAGQDIHSHQGNLRNLIIEVAGWLRTQSRDPSVPGGQRIAAEFASFLREIPAICRRRSLHPDELTFGDYADMVLEYLAITT